MDIKERLAGLAETAMSKEPKAFAVAEICLDAITEIEKWEQVAKACRTHALAVCPSEDLKTAIGRITHEAGVQED